MADFSSALIFICKHLIYFTGIATFIQCKHKFSI